MTDSLPTPACRNALRRAGTNSGNPPLPPPFSKGGMGGFGSYFIGNFYGMSYETKVECALERNLLQKMLDLCGGLSGSSSLPRKK